jgi:hypothetical protein
MLKCSNILCRILTGQRYKILIHVILLCLMELIFLNHAALFAMRNIHSAEWDQSAYLKLALQIKHGISLTDGSRNPLYPLFLVPMARQAIGFFTDAKVLSLIIGGMGLLIIYGVAHRIVGGLGALSVTGLMAINSKYHHFAGFVDAEILLTPIFFVAWYMVCRTIKNVTHIIEEDFADASQIRQQGWLALMSGIVTSLVYLTKGTGLLLIMIFCATLLFLNGPRFIKNRLVWYFLGSFALLSLPLWMYNWHYYDSPLYNINTTHIMWLDDWDLRYLYSDDNLPTMMSYLQSHSAREIISRLIHGLLASPTQWMRSVWPALVASSSDPFVSAPITVLSMTLLGALLALGIWRRAYAHQWRARRGWLIYTLLGMGSFWFLFSWYRPVSDDARFIFPWVPVLYVAPCWLLKESLSNFKSEKLLGGGYAFLVIIASVVLATGEFPLSDIATMWKRDQVAGRESIDFMGTLIEKTEPGDFYLLGPTHRQAEWMAYDRTNLRIPVIRQDWYSFSTWLAEHNVEYALLDFSMWLRRETLLSRYWKIAEEGQLALIYETGPSGWALIKPTSYPCDPCLFRVDQQILVPPHSSDVRYGVYSHEIMQLEGYQISPEPSAADRPWRLDLYWRLLVPTTMPIHSFVHVLQQGEFVTQHDGTLVEGEFPGTSGSLANHDLQAGTIIVESHPMPALPEGRYHLHIGLYDFNTKIRLTATIQEEGDAHITDYPAVITMTVVSSED